MKECPCAEKCYRKNPIHFGEFAHAHLDAIYAKGKVAGAYEIPAEYSSELIEIQLKLLEKLFPKREQEVVVPASTSGSSDSTSASCSTSSSRKTPSSSENSSHVAKKPKLERNIRDYIPVVVEKGGMARKMEQAAPYNMFLTAITDSKPTHTEPLSVTLLEIFDESLGEIESTAQINFMVDIRWLLRHHYFAGIPDKPLLVLYGHETPALVTIGKHSPQVTTIGVKMPTPFATSQSKIMLLAYKDGGMRVVISTANLYKEDWRNRTQGVWISPKLPALPALPEDADTRAGESPTGFKRDLMYYLAKYKIAQLLPWIVRIQNSDFSAINVFFLGSVPGDHRWSTVRGHPWGHAHLGALLDRHAAPVADHIPVVCQSSSIGNLGPNVQAWVQQDFINSLKRDSSFLGKPRPMPAFKMIYPSLGNVSGSHDGMLGGTCLAYGKSSNDKQPWLQEHLHQWKSSDRYRSRAMPHIASYTRYNLENQSVYWFVLTSANLTRSAWGCFNRSRIQPRLRIANYEAGVLFLPRFVTGEDTFPMGNSRNGVPAFPLPYDVPLTPYAPDDEPFLQS
ncbi:hypothetical protein KR018_006540 [Drosophila ironensis]|nr:hypothetical protein KR018_006540 [Drosophila ironensis]